MKSSGERNSIMGTFPDVMHQFKTGENAVEMGRKGGLSADPRNKSVGQKLRLMKKAGATDEQVQWLYDLAMDGDASFVNISKELQTLYSAAKPGSKAFILDRIISMHKMRHGSKEFNHKVDLTATIVTAKFELPTEFNKPQEIVVTNSPNMSDGQKT